MSKNIKITKYRYIFIIILIIIIILLIFFINLVKNLNKSESIINESKTEENMIDKDIMVVEIEEEKKKKEEQEAEQEKIEEKNATGIIYLTFDDGPSHDSTPKILEILKKENVKATFFVLHYSEENEHLIKQEQDNGHTIALHGYTHTYSEIYQSVDTCLENFRKIQKQVYETTGIKSNIIRFPGGSSNTVSRKYCQGVMTELSQRVVEEGFRYYDWNVDSTDAARPKSSEIIYNNVVRGIKPNRDNVVLMHDFAGNQKTIDALEGIIKYGKENGYVFRKLTEKVPMVTHGINN